MKKIRILSLMVLGIFLIAGLMATTIADREITDMSEYIQIENFFAGSTVTANFSYKYLRDLPQNPDNSPLVLRISINSSDEQYPVWVNDFEIDGYIERKILFGIIVTQVPFSCSEHITSIQHPLGEVEVVPQNGTFYCFDPEGNLDFEDFNAKDNVFLNIHSDPALWPGNYTFKAELFWIDDSFPPIVNILNKDYFGSYFRDGSYVEFNAEIKDINLVDYRAKMIIPGHHQNISFSKQHLSGDIYHFFSTLPYDIPEGYWEVLVTAEDSYGNIGADKVILGIDRTPPEINLIEPTEVVSGKFFIKFNVADEKAGVDYSSVKVRLREILNNQICPETGGPIGNGFSCITTPWISLDYNEKSGLFEVYLVSEEYNLTSGEYWLDAVAKDILENEAQWIA